MFKQFWYWFNYYGSQYALPVADRFVMALKKVRGVR